MRSEWLERWLRYRLEERPVLRDLKPTQAGGLIPHDTVLVTIAPGRGDQADRMIDFYQSRD